MKREETKLKGLSDSRFHSIIYFFRMAGVPLKIKKISSIYAIYMIIVIVCASTTCLGMCVDVYVHRDDLGRAMTTMCVLIPLTSVVWISWYYT
jgi:hypothetical protein